MEKIKIRDEKSKKILKQLVELDKESDGNVFENQKSRTNFKKYIDEGVIPKQHYNELWDLIGQYGLADRRHIDYLYKQAEKKLFKE